MTATRKKSVFDGTNSIIGNLDAIIPLKDAEKKQLDALIKHNRVGTGSDAFKLVSIGKLGYSDLEMNTECIFSKEGRILYWKENYRTKETGHRYAASP